MRIKIQNLLRINPAIFIYILVFLTPFSFYSIQLNGDIGLTPINIYTIALVFITIIIIFYRNAIPVVPSINYYHFIYMLIALVSSIYASNQLGAISGIGAYAIKFYTCFFFPIFFLKNRRQIEISIYIFIIVGFMNALMGWSELVGYYIFGEVIIPPFGESYFTTTKAYGYPDRGGIGAFSIPGFMRMYGFMAEGANTFGTYMLIPFGFSLYLLNKYKKITYFLLSLFFGTTILVSVSRNAIMGMLFLLVTIYFIRAIHSGVLSKLIIKIYSLLIILFFIGILAFVVQEYSLLSSSEVRIDSNTTQYNLNYLLNRFNPFASTSMSKSFSYFTDHLKIALFHCIDNFGFGMGLQNFDNFVFQHYRSQVVGYSSHSNFITFLGDTGIWGLLTQVCIVILTIRYGLIAYFRQVVKDTLPLYLTCIFIALVITGIIRTYYLDTYTFIIMGLITTIYILNNKKKLNISQLIH